MHMIYQKICHGVIKRSYILGFLMIVFQPSSSSMDLNSIGETSRPKLKLALHDEIGISSFEGDDRDFHSNIKNEGNPNQLELMNGRNLKKKAPATSGSVSISRPKDLIPVHSTEKEILENACMEIENWEDNVMAGQIKKVKGHKSNIITKIEDLEDRVEELKKKIPENIFNIYLTNLKNTVNDLYNQKITEIQSGKMKILQGEKAVFYVHRQDESSVILDKYSPFSFFIQCVDHAPERFGKEEEANMSNWSDLMIEFYYDLKKLELVSPQYLLDFEEKDQGRLFASFIIAKYPQYNVYSAYLNFDLRLSIAEDRKLKDSNLKEIFQEYDDENWNQLDYWVLVHKLKYNQGIISYSGLDLFKPIREEFLEKLSPQSSGPVPEMSKLFEKIIAYIPSLRSKPFSFQRDALHYNAIYGMERLMQRKYPEIISDEFKKSLQFQQICAFEEAIGLISSLNHFSYEIPNLFRVHFDNEEKFYFPKSASMMGGRYQNRMDDQAQLSMKIYPFKEHLKGLPYLTDLNQNRMVSNLNSNRNAEAVERDSGQLKKIKRLPIFKKLSKHCNNVMGSFLQAQVEFPLELKQHVEQQFISYYLQLEKLKDHEEMETSKAFSESIEILVFFGLEDFEILQEKLQISLKEFIWTILPSMKVITT